jgi:hypothetical protein
LAIRILVASIIRFASNGYSANSRRIEIVIEGRCTAAPMGGVSENLALRETPNKSPSMLKYTLTT